MFRSVRLRTVGGTILAGASALAAAAAHATTANDLCAATANPCRVTRSVNVPLAPRGIFRMANRLPEKRSDVGDRRELSRLGVPVGSKVACRCRSIPTAAAGPIGHPSDMTVDEIGLDKVDRAVLDALCRRFAGGPVGLKTLAIAVSEPDETVEDVYEPFLIQQGLLVRTQRGRVATRAAWEHLGIAPPEPVVSEEAPGLFG